MIFDTLELFFGADLIASLPSEFLAILCLGVLILFSWITIKIFKAIGLLF